MSAGARAATSNDVAAERLAMVDAPAIVGGWLAIHAPDDAEILAIHAAWRGLRAAVATFDRFENAATRQNALGRISAFCEIIGAASGRPMADLVAAARR